MPLAAAFGLAAALGLGGCGASGPSEPADAARTGPKKCKNNDDCGDQVGATYCKVDPIPGACVQCLVHGHCRTATAPRCENNRCRGCLSGAECESSVCNPDGSCAPPAPLP